MLIGFEGVDCAGKTTQVKLLAQRLSDLGYSVVTFSEKEDTELGRLTLAEKRISDPTAAYLASVASKAELSSLLDRVPDHCHFVILDRFVPSLLAYAPDHVFYNRPLYYAIRRCIKPGKIFPKVDLCILLTTTYERYCEAMLHKVDSTGNESVMSEERFNEICRRYRSATYGVSRWKTKLNTSKLTPEETSERILETVLGFWKKLPDVSSPRDMGWMTIKGD